MWAGTRAALAELPWPANSRLRVRPAPPFCDSVSDGRWSVWYGRCSSFTIYTINCYIEDYGSINACGGSRYVSVKFKRKGNHEYMF